MSMFDGISQVQVGLGRYVNKIVRKWTDEQTDLFAGVLTQKHFKNGKETTWSEELESLAVKKSSNEYVFKEIQDSLEKELEKSDQSHREPGDEATFTIPQLRAKYKWLKREWKAIQTKIKCGLLCEDAKCPNWFDRLHHIFSVHIDSDRRDDDRPSMVSENGPLLNSRSGIYDSNSVDDCNEIGERSWIVNIEPQPSTNPENCGKNHGDVENDANVADQNEALTRKRPFETQEIRKPNTKIQKLNSHIAENNHTSDYTTVPCQCNCKLDKDRYIEIIKNILNAEERREKMLVDLQREQAQLSRQHELKMAQMFIDMASQQRILVAEIGSIKDLILSKK